MRIHGRLIETLSLLLTTTQTPCLNPEKRMHLASKLVKIHSYSCWVCLSAFSFGRWTTWCLASPQYAICQIAH